MATTDPKLYLPEFYARDFGKSNSVVHTADVLGEILKEVESEPFNNWDDPTSLEKELHIKELIVSGFKIRDTRFLKAFFAFKGTNLDLQYILKNIGYDSVIYNDGGYVHRGLDGVDKVIQINPFYKETITEPRCQIEIKVLLDLSVDDEFGGYFGLDLARVKGICQERLNSCSYLSRVFIEAVVKESYETMKWTDDYLIVMRNLEALEDSYFTEYKLPEVVYGEEFNEGLRYGKEYNKELAYGNHNQILFRPLDDKLVLGSKSDLPEVAMGLNDEGEGTIQTSEFVDILVSKPQYDTYQHPIDDRLEYSLRKGVWLSDDASLGVEDALNVGRGYNLTFIETPRMEYVYGRESNARMKYGEGRDTYDFGNKDGSVASYGDAPLNQSNEHPALSLNGDDPTAIVDLSDAVEIVVKRRED